MDSDRPQDEPPSAPAAPLDEQGRRRDLERRLELSESRYRRLVENLRDEYFFYSHGPDGVFTYLSPSVSDILGYGVDEYLTHYAEYFTDDPVNERALSHTERSLAGVRQRPYELEVRHRDGSTKRLEVQEVPVKDGTGAVIAVEGIAHDVTERRKDERELLRVQKLDALGVLSGGIAHDFNNLLTVIIGNTSLLLQDCESGGEPQALLQDIQSASTQAKRLTWQLLTFAKGGKPLKSLCDIGPLISDSVQLTTRGTVVAARVRIADDLRPIEADAAQLQQVIHNLVINAVESMPQGGVVEVTCDNAERAAEGPLPLAPGPYVHLAVVDQGAGIPPDHLGHVFDPYFTTKQSGSGLGLAVCHSVVKGHGGHISVSSRLGSGARFEVWLPAVEGPRPAGQPKAPVAPARPARILLLDDEPLVRRALERMLRRAGHQAVSVADGQEAIDVYERERVGGSPFDLVILDLTIPGGVGGVAVIQALKRCHPEVRAVVSSGYSSDPVMAQYRDYGFCGVMAKPYTERDVRVVLNGVLGPASSRPAPRDTE